MVTALAAGGGVIVSVRVVVTTLLLRKDRLHLSADHVLDFGVVHCVSRVVVSTSVCCFQAVIVCTCEEPLKRIPRFISARFLLPFFTW